MKTLTIACLVAVLATLTIVGSNQAATTTSIDKWFRIVGETDAMIDQADAALFDLEYEVVCLDELVDQVYLGYEKGVDHENLRSYLDGACARVRVLNVSLADCRTELRECHGVLDVALEEALRMDGEGIPGAQTLLLGIKGCCTRLAAAESRCTPCLAELEVLEQRIDDLYALLLLP